MVWSDKTKQPFWQKYDVKYHTYSEVRKYHGLELFLFSWYRQNINDQREDVWSQVMGNSLEECVAIHQDDEDDHAGGPSSKTVIQNILQRRLSAGSSQEKQSITRQHINRTSVERIEDQDSPVGHSSRFKVWKNPT